MIEGGHEWYQWIGTIFLNHSTNMIKTCPKVSYEAAQNRFLLFKGPGSPFKKLNIMWKWRVFLDPSIDTTHDLPL
jgi:hypothetical protein